MVPTDSKDIYDIPRYSNNI